MDLQRVFADNHARPNTLDHLVFGNELPCRPDQELHDLECSSAERHGDATGTQFAARQVDFPLLAFVNQFFASLGHACASPQGFSILKVS